MGCEVEKRDQGQATELSTNPPPIAHRLSRRAHWPTPVQASLRRRLGHTQSIALAVAEPPH